LRDRIADSGWLVVDASNGYELKPKPPYDVLDRITDLPDNSTSADTRRASVGLVVDGWPDDVRACIESLLTHTTNDVVVLALDLGNVDGAGDALHEVADDRVQVWHLAGSTGWSQARNGLLRVDTARIHVWCDVSTLCTGDALTPLLDAIDESGDVVGAGWRGVRVDLDDEWRSFVDGPAGDVDAVLGYLFAMRRASALAAGGPHPKARFYRNADIEFSFALKEAAPGARLVVPPGDLPVRQARHHGYYDTDPDYRDKESARTYNRFLQRFRGRSEFLAPRT
jgi:hypothetical protein